jgi:hypothetical protein
MDLKALREEAIEATGRFFADHRDVPPDPDSDEWETEYRRQFELAKKRAAAKRSAAPASAPAAAADEKLPEIRGAPAQQRWAITIRAERLKAIQDKDVRGWVAGAWTAKEWVDTRDLPTPAFLRRVTLQYADHRREAEAQAGVERAEQQAKAAEAAAAQRALQAAGITAQGLVELIDASTRAAASPRKAKLAELEVEGRSLRVFETEDAAILMVIENAKAGRAEYCIERDAGLAADLALFGRATPP